MKTIPKELRHNATWRGALYILEPAFPDQEDDVWEYVDVDPGQPYEIHFKEMIANRGWSTTEMLLLQSAASLFAPEFPLNLYRLVSRLDDRQLQIVLNAIGDMRSRDSFF